MRKLLLLLALAVFTGSASAEPVVGLGTGNRIFTFDSATPGTVTFSTTLSGFATGDTLIGIDFRPSNGQLIGVGYNGTTGRIYNIDPLTGTVSQQNVNSIPYGSGSTSFGVDFNPVANALRLISNGAAPNNLRSPAGGTGAIVTDTALSSGAGSPSTNVVAAAYTNSTPPPVVGPTTMYTIADAGAGVFQLSTQGAIGGGAGPLGPNAGIQNLIATITGLAPGDIVNGFDVSGGTGTAYISTQNGLYSLNLLTGVASPLGNFGGGFAGSGAGLSIVSPNSNLTPAPAAWLAFGLGGLALTGFRRLRRKTV